MVPASLCISTDLSALRRINKGIHCEFSEVPKSTQCRTNPRILSRTVAMKWRLMAVRLRVVSTTTRHCPERVVGLVPTQRCPPAKSPHSDIV